LQETKGVEVGHIFKLGTRYSKPMKVLFTTESGSQQEVLMGCFGMGVDRIIAGAVEQKNDERGIIWPDSIAPYSVHLLSLDGGDVVIKTEAEALYKKLTDKNIEVLFDDRDEKAGVKFSEADLIGIPYRIVLSKKSKELGGVEVKRRDSEEKEIIAVGDIDRWIAGL
jgi:prolyl-tRNA synthetase